MRIQANLQVRRILHNGHDVAVRLIPGGLCEAASRKNQCNSAVASMDTLKNGVLTACHNNDDNTVKAPGSLLFCRQLCCLGCIAFKATAKLCIHGQQMSASQLTPHFPSLHSQFRGSFHLPNMPSLDTSY